MQHIHLRADIPRDLFVGTIDGETSCSPDDEEYDIWPKLLVMVFLHGSQHFVIDGKSFRVDAGSVQEEKPRILMLNIARASKLRFVNEGNVPLKKIQISAPLPWINELIERNSDGIPEFHEFLRSHLDEFRFEPDQYTISLAEQLINPPPSMEGEMRKLFKNARALDVIVIACSALVGHRKVRDRPRLIAHQRCLQIRNYILSRINEPLTIERIAHDAGASVSWVQRHFREEFGVGVFEFIRTKRLELGRYALENEGATIAQAAYAAGYLDPGSFAAAFRKTFGTLPKELRR